MKGPATLSSLATVYMKFIFPVLWIAGFSSETLALFLASDPQPDTAFMTWVFLAFAFAGTLALRWICMPLKRVRMDDTALYISNYSKEIIVPLRDIAEITENRWINIHPITINFHTQTEFGMRIKFMPKTRWFSMWSSHPVVAQISGAAVRATGGASPV